MKFELENNSCTDIVDVRAKKQSKSLVQAFFSFAKEILLV